MRPDRSELVARISDYLKALSDFSDAIRLNPQDTAALAHRGEAYMARFDAKGAAADLDGAAHDVADHVF